MRGSAPISEIADESYISLALENWLLQASLPAPATQALARLAQNLETNHRDKWMLDFLHSKTSPTANMLLLDAIRANYSGNADSARQAAGRAEQIYLREGNQAGALRSEFERVYALRRGSQSAKCLQLAAVVARSSAKLRYLWIEIQTTIEQSSCEGMRGEADAAWVLAGTAIEKAISAKYHILHLRALGLRGNLDMVEGRSDASWINNEEALHRFWEDAFPDERGFQLYYNLQVDAEKNGAIYLALTLQRETLTMIAGHARIDFEAMAHFRMAGAAQTVGDIVTARWEVARYKELIAKLPLSDARALYEAYCEIGLARLSILSGNVEEARQHLTNAAPVASPTQNAMLRLEFLKTSADLDHISKSVTDEQKHLGEITAIANEGFNSLKSVTDRWRWSRVVEEAYRRIFEIDLSSPHSSGRALGYWEVYRQLESSPSLPPKDSAARANIEHLAEGRVSRLHDTTLVSFAVLSGSVVAWIADDRGIHEIALPVNPPQLKEEARRFYSLCSDPHSSIEKVNASGLRLYQWLIAPLEGVLANDRTLQIEPDGVLGLVPWTALRTPDGSYWGSQRTMAISTGLFSSSADARPHEKTAVKNVTIAIPNSLRLNGQNYLQPANADEEATELAKLYPATKELRGNAATGANIVREIPQAEVFEFAGHAVTREHGGELVVHAEDEAGILSGASLAVLNLKKTRLVVLSACSTAAERDADRDPNGLVRALLNAGAGHVIATRWDVDSRSTAEVMKLFYRSFKTGMTEAQSLQAARRALSANEEFAHPYYWAGSELYSVN